MTQDTAIKKGPPVHRGTSDQFLTFLETRQKQLKEVTIGKLTVAVRDEAKIIKINDGEFKLEGKEQKELLTSLRIPSTLFKRVSPQLGQALLNEMAAKYKTKKKLVFKAGKLVADRPIDAPSIPALPVFETAFKVLPKPDKVVYIDVDDAVDARIICSSLQTKPKVNDIVHGGIRFLYSEVESRRPQIEPYTERLVCLNGMCHHENHTVFALDEKRPFLKEVEKQTKVAMDQFAKVIAVNMLKSTKIKVDSTQAVRRIFQMHKISDRFYDAVLKALKKEKDGTAYGVLQAFTLAAQDFGYRDQTRLQSYAARELVAAGNAHCAECYAAL